ncbi:MAG: hypothetical protein QOH21_282, partial [Acidobacteriota bacterium]|nr:hypothetical protein [Acidobacteriota bacterium]
QVWKRRVVALGDCVSLSANMRLTASLITFVLLGALLAACGGDGNSGDKPGNPTPEASASPDATPKPDSSDGGGNDGSGDQNVPKTTALTKSQLERARVITRSLAVCLRNADVFVSTESNAPKSLTLKLGKGVMLRVEWKKENNAADIYVGGTRRNTRLTKRALDKQPKVYKRKILVLYDKKPSSDQSGTVEECANRDVP